MDRIELSKTNGQSLGYFDPVAMAERFDTEYKCVKKMYYMDMAIWVYQDEDTPDTMSVDVVTISDYKRVMEMELSKVHKRGVCYHVDIVRMDKKYRGQGLAPKLYKHIVKALGIVIQAGEAQSPGGRYIWNTLAGMNDCSVYGKFRYGQWHQLFKGDSEPELGWNPGGDMHTYDGREFTMYLSA